MTYKLGDTASCEATVGRQLALACQFDSRLCLVVEDLSILVRDSSRKRR
jgi:hypothetical protein